MSKIILNGFRIDSTHTDLQAILIKNLLWYNSINSSLMIGSKKLNYYVENNEKILTTLTQIELPNKIVLPLEFSVISKI